MPCRGPLGNQRRLYNNDKGTSRGAGPVPRRLGHDAGSPRLSFKSTGIRGHGVITALAGATGRGVFVLFDTASRGRVFGAF